MIHQMMSLLTEACKKWQTPSVTLLAEHHRTAFHVLISCIISLRTKDAVTMAASVRLFNRAGTVQDMASLTTSEIAELIYPAGFYRTKSEQISDICKRLVSEFNAEVPDTIEQLLTFKGVGRKTANLVVTLGYGKQGICVDTHVHRITNRWGYICTKTPEQTEMALRANLPEEYWHAINDLLVCFGQNLCHPVSPRCSICPLTLYCARIGVERYR